MVCDFRTNDVTCVVCNVHCGAYDITMIVWSGEEDLFRVSCFVVLDVCEIFSFVIRSNVVYANLIDRTDVFQSRYYHENMQSSQSDKHVEHM